MRHSIQHLLENHTWTTICDFAAAPWNSESKPDTETRILSEASKGCFEKSESEHVSTSALFLIVPNRSKVSSNFTSLRVVSFLVVFLSTLYILPHACPIEMHSSERSSSAFLVCLRDVQKCIYSRSRYFQAWFQTTAPMKLICSDFKIESWCNRLLSFLSASYLWQEDISLRSSI